MAEHELTLQAVKNTIKQLAGQANTLSVPRVFVTLTGDHVSAILLSQIIYWSERTKDPEGWFYKTTDDWFDEIGVTYSQLCTAIEKLRPLGLETSIRKIYSQTPSGGTPKAHYRINEETFYTALIGVLGQNRKSENPKLGKSESQKIRKSDNLNPTFDKSKSDFQKSRKSYKEADITTEITTETTHTTQQRASAPVSVREFSSNGKGKSRFSLQDCTRYAEHLKASGQGIVNPGGYATAIFRSGEADALIEAFQNRARAPDVKECPDCKGAGFVHVDPRDMDRGVRPCKHEKLKAK